jgi:hypothetical protein
MRLVTWRALFISPYREPRQHGVLRHQEEAPAEARQVLPAGLGLVEVQVEKQLVLLSDDLAGGSLRTGARSEVGARLYTGYLLGEGSYAEEEEEEEEEIERRSYARSQ